MAPEVVLGKPYSFGCDVWGLGCIMYRVLTCTSPFWDDDPEKRLKRIKNDKLVFDDHPNLQTLSEPGRSILSAMLEKDPERRPTIRLVFRHRWFDAPR
mmetsp:Transcript_11483/g.15491  ORF Transcript_11483/g.15491 Transcript_11483/m.15491 type:complete len:98 (-) Transcript_11483:84-377(-)